MRALLALAFTLWVHDGAVWHPVRAFPTEDACVEAAWRVGLVTGRLAECRLTYRL